MLQTNFPWPFTKGFKTKIASSFLCLVISSCGTEVKDDDARVIATSSDVIDLMLSQAQPDAVFINDRELKIGIDQQNSENRMLLYFPNIEELFDPATVRSSITQVEVRIFATTLKANPENIQLSLVGERFTPMATWNSPIPYLPDSVWQSPGGTINPEFHHFSRYWMA